MSPAALIVFVLVALWLVAMLVAALRYAATARARAGAETGRPAPARTYAEVRRRRD